MLDKEQIENWHTIYDKAGLRVDALDMDAVAMYAENKPVIEMTLAEWKQINTALEGLKE